MRVEISGKRFAFSHSCACCGASADSELAASATRTTGKRVIKTKTNTWKVPYCSKCLAHVQAWQAASSAGAALLALVVGGAICLANVAVGVVIAIGGLAVAIGNASRARAAARAMCSPTCACPDPAVQYLGWSGTVESFDFRSDAYALRFMQDNRSKLVNVAPAARTALAAAAQTLMTPAPAAAKDDSDASLLSWLGRIEAARGPATRRAMVERALKDIGADQQRELIQAAAKIELRATLDKVDALKTVAAKTRYLADAIEALRSDSAADELQAAEIQALEDTLRAL